VNAAGRVPGVVPIDTPAEPGSIMLDGGGSEVDAAAEIWFKLNGKPMVRNVVRATLTPFLPKDGGTGAAVIVSPGGGYLIASMASEGWAPARWLAERGIAAFVLKYRLQETPRDDGAFTLALAERFRAAADPARHTAPEVPSCMVEDAAAAMRLVRENAALWAIDPDRVGYLGFSAGAMIGIELSATREAAPQFLGAIYPSMAARDVPAAAPPLFVAMAADDQLYARTGYGLIDCWQRANAPVELHVYASGGHGYGMGLPGTTSVGTMPAFLAWLKHGGWLQAGAKGAADD
jgi:acetyl esterase/lipase